MKLTDQQSQIYLLQSFDSKINDRIGHSKRLDLATSRDTPGVGNYNLRKNPGSGPEYGFGSEPRDRPSSAFSSVKNPGPGTYQLKSSIDPKSKGFTILSRKPDYSLEMMRKNPGPGTYSPEKPMSKSNVKFPQKTRDSIAKTDRVPGPGTYEPLFTTLSEKTKLPSYGYEN